MTKARSRKAFSRWLRSVAAVLGLLAGAASVARGADTPARGLQPLGRPAPAFEENIGQLDPQVRFRAKAEGYGILLADRESVLTLGRDARARVRMTFVGAGPSGVRGEAERKGRIFYVSDPARPTAGAARFDRVRYRARGRAPTSSSTAPTSGRCASTLSWRPGPISTASASPSTAPTGSRSSRAATSYSRSAEGLRVRKPVVFQATGGGPG